MKSVILAAALFVTLLASTALVMPAPVSAAAPSQCDRLESQMTRQSHAIKKHTPSKHTPKNKWRTVRDQRIKKSAMNALKILQRKHEIRCATRVCGDIQPAICAANRGEMCIQSILPQEFGSMEDLRVAGALFLNKGACPVAPTL